MDSGVGDVAVLLFSQTPFHYSPTTQHKTVRLFIHFVQNRDMKADKNGAGLPA